MVDKYIRVDGFNSIAEPADHSDTITLGGTAQPLMPANPSRRGVIIQNLSSGDLWINDLGDDAEPAQPSFRLSAGISMRSSIDGVFTGAISIFGATTGQAFTAREW